MKPYAATDRLSRDNAALMMIDHQTGLLSGCRDMSPETLTNNIAALAQVGKFFHLPVVLTQGGRGGVTAVGPFLRQLAGTFPTCR